MNNNDLKAKFNEYYYLSKEIVNNIVDDVVFEDIIKVIEILVRIDKNE